MDNIKILQILLGVMAVGAIIAAVWLGFLNGSAPKNTGGKEQKTEYETVQLYYYNENNDKDADGNVRCSKEGLVPVERKIAASATPVQDTVNLLLKGDLSAQEQASGISTEYPLPGVTLKGASLKDGELTLEFNDPQNKTGGGACRVSVLWSQIEATAKQFPDVTSVKFIPDDLFQP